MGGVRRINMHTRQSSMSPRAHVPSNRHSPSAHIPSKLHGPKTGAPFDNSSSLGWGGRGRDALQGGGYPPPPLEGAKPVPSHCLPDAKCQAQWHL